ncbi:MAG: sugar phosphate isomerase/epimerase [Stappiaceae bacterium]
MMDLSYQLYSSREFPPLADTLKLLADIGYKSVEAYGGLLDDPDTLDSALSASGLSLDSSHVGLDALESKPDWVAEIAQRFGIKSLFCPFLMSDQRPETADGWREFGARLGRIDETFSSNGVRVGWHNHDFEFVPLPTGERPMDLILEGAPSLQWEADVAWIVRGGVDPMAYLQKYGDRITALHIKDIAPAGNCADEDGWADVGHGTMDWSALLKAASTLNVKHYVMEHDKPNDHERFARRSFASVQAILES